MKVKVLDSGIEVGVADGATGFIRKAELSRDRVDQRPDRFAVAEKVDAKVISIDRATRRYSLSIKAREIEEDKQAMAQYGSSDSGASLGDILGAALTRATKERAAKGKGKDEAKEEKEETEEEAEAAEEGEGEK